MAVSHSQHYSTAPGAQGNVPSLSAGLALGLGGVLLLGAGIVLAISLGGWGAAAALLGSIAGGAVALMAAVFSATARSSETKSRFNLLKLAGLLCFPGAVALGLAVGGLLGAGLGLLVAASGLLLVGIGIVVGMP